MSNASAVATFLAQCTTLVKKAPHFLLHTDLCPRSTNQLIEISSHCVSNGDTYAAKHGALFLTHYFQVDSPSVKRQVEFYGPLVIEACFLRLKTEISTALVNQVADVLFILWSKYPNFWINWRTLTVCQNDCVAKMFREINNKMKYRELARQININCRKGLLLI
uniref:Uncharacterized protein n=1 Tax=Romanomermis culicivorax TaxID=13658 RepID=A0A915K021_ROMCU